MRERKRESEREKRDSGREQGIERAKGGKSEVQLSLFGISKLPKDRRSERALAGIEEVASQQLVRGVALSTLNSSHPQDWRNVKPPDNTPRRKPLRAALPHVHRAEGGQRARDGALGGLNVSSPGRR